MLYAAVDFYPQNVEREIEDGVEGEVGVLKSGGEGEDRSPFELGGISGYLGGEEREKRALFPKRKTMSTVTTRKARR